MGVFIKTTNATAILARTVLKGGWYLNTHYHIHLKLACKYDHHQSLPVAEADPGAGNIFVRLVDYWKAQVTINLVALKLKTLQRKNHLQLLSCKLFFIVSFNHVWDLFKLTLSGQIVSKLYFTSVMLQSLCQYIMTTARFKNVAETKG